MSILADRLRNRIAVWDKVEIENELHEDDFEWQEVKKIWSEIIPVNGVEKTTQANALYANVTHKITIRTKSITGLNKDMYFVYDGQRFDIQYFQPHYKYRDCMEIYCNWRIEGQVIN